MMRSVPALVLRWVWSRRAGSIDRRGATRRAAVAAVLEPGVDRSAEGNAPRASASPRRRRCARRPRRPPSSGRRWRPAGRRRDVSLIIAVRRRPRATCRRLEHATTSRWPTVPRRAAVARSHHLAHAADRVVDRLDRLHVVVPIAGHRRQGVARGAPSSAGFGVPPSAWALASCWSLLFIALKYCTGFGLILIDSTPPQGWPTWARRGRARPVAVRRRSSAAPATYSSGRGS